MSSENCQDFEVKYINDACVSVCVHLCACVFAEQGKRLWPVMVTKLYQHYKLFVSRI